MNSEFLKILDNMKEILGCDLKISYQNESVCTNDEINYTYEYKGSNYKVMTSKLLNKQLIDLMKIPFDNLLKNKLDYGRFFNNLIDNKNDDFLHLNKVERSLILIDCERPIEVLEMLQEVIEDEEYIFIKDLKYVIMLVVKIDVEQYCLETINSIEVELMQKAKLAYSKPFTDIKTLGHNYSLCLESLKIGSIFKFRETVFSVNDNKLEKVFYYLNSSKRRELLLDYPQIRNLNNEEITTINALFENDLNITKTAKAMYIHRNTLIYRIDKIDSKTDLNILDFNDAIMLRFLLILIKIEDNDN